MKLDSFVLALGGFVDPISQQLDKGGFVYDPELVERWQADMVAISRLSLRNIITYSAGQKAYDRLATRIVTHVKGLNAGS